MPNTNSVVTFHQCELADFNDALDTAGGGSGLVTGGLYFITDQQIIVRATGATTYEQYGGAVKIGSLPTSGSEVEGVLYITATTGGYNGQVWNGSSWVNVFSPNDTVQQSMTSSGGSGAVSGTAVANYINSLLAANATANTNDSTRIIPTIDTTTHKLDPSLIPVVTLSNFVGSFSSVSALNQYTSANLDSGDWAVVNGSTASENGSYVYAIDISSSASNTTPSWIRLADKLDEISVTGTITEGSSDAITSGAVYAALNWQPVSTST